MIIIKVALAADGHASPVRAVIVFLSISPIPTSFIAWHDTTESWALIWLFYFFYKHVVYKITRQKSKQMIVTSKQILIN